MLVITILLLCCSMEAYNDYEDVLLEYDSISYGNYN